MLKNKLITLAITVALAACTPAVIDPGAITGSPIPTPGGPVKSSLSHVALIAPRLMGAALPVDVPAATSGSLGVVRPDNITTSVDANGVISTIGSGSALVANPTIKVTLKPSANIPWTINGTYGLLRLTALDSSVTNTDVAAVLNNGTDYGFVATRNGAKRITGQVWFILPEMIQLINQQYVVRWFKNGSPSTPCSDGNGQVFSPDVGTGALFNGNVIWGWLINIQAEDPYGVVGDTYRPCLYATLAGSGDYVDWLHSRFTFTEEP